jgi:quinol monooxygenase YgiN
MIVIAGTVPIKPEARAEAIAVAGTWSLRREPGCRAYRFSIDLDDPNLVCIFEE